jgi:hypothetical protein
MCNNFTPEDLLIYLYKETDAAQTAAIEKALQENWTLMEKFKVLKAAVKGLSELAYAPRTEAVLNILHHAAENQSTNRTGNFIKS